MTIEAYVTIHDQDLVLECERSGQFDAIDHTYLFVGPRPVDRIPGYVKLVLAREHENNFEHYPQFYDFTGWHVLAAHDLIDADHIITLQYDMQIVDATIGDRCTILLDTGPGPIAFTVVPYLAAAWMLRMAGFKETYDTGLARLGVDQATWPPFDQWPCTQGMAWRTDEFVRCMHWIEPLFEVWHDNLWAGHLMERTVKAWCAIHDITEHYLTGVIHHLASDCHGTCALMAGSSDVHAERSAIFGREVI